MSQISVSHHPSLSLSASSPLLSLPVTVQSPHRSTIVMLSNGNYLCRRHPVLKKSLSAFICLSNHTGLVEGNQLASLCTTSGAQTLSYSLSSLNNVSPWTSVQHSIFILFFLFCFFHAATVCLERFSFSGLVSLLLGSRQQTDVGACMCISVPPLATMPLSCLCI